MISKQPGMQSAKIIIIGGGAIGLSTACHLGLRGESDVLLLERHELTSGTSWHAAGIIGPLRASLSATRLAMYAPQFFRELEQHTKQSTGYQQTGVNIRPTPLAKIIALPQH